MSQNRNLILREPGHLILNAAGTPATFYSETPWTVELVEEVVPIPSAMFGELDRVPVGRMVKIKGIPQQFSDGAISKLFPFASKARGASLLGATDTTLDIHTTTGKRCRIPNAFVYAEPEIRGDVRKTPIGEVEFWGIVPLNGNANSLASFFNETSVAYPGDSLFDTTEIITPSWSITWGGAPWDAIDLGDSGFSIKPVPKYDEDKVNGIGVTNVALTDYGVTVDFEPMNISRADAMARAGFGTSIGGRKSSNAYDFIAQSSGIYIAVRNAAMVPGQGFSFAAQQRSVGKLKLQSIRSFVDSTEVAQLYVGTSAPA